MKHKENNWRPFKAKVSRPGIHSKTKTSSSKKARNYKKSYKGQGR